MFHSQEENKYIQGVPKMNNYFKIMLRDAKTLCDFKDKIVFDVTGSIYSNIMNY